MVVGASFDASIPSSAPTSVAATTIEAHTRGRKQRKKYLVARSSETTIAAHRRGFVQRRRYKQQRSSAQVIQRAQRRRSARLKRKEVFWDEAAPDAQQIDALNLVNRMLAMPEDKETAPKLAAQFLSDDFVDECKLAGQKHETKGARDYMAAAMRRPTQKVTSVDVQPWVTRSTIDGSCTVIEREVRLGGFHRVRVEYTVRHGAGSDEGRICRRLTTPVDYDGDEDDGEEGETSLSPTGKLRRALATLDADGSGCLSLDEIVKATKMVGLQLNKSELHKTLLVGDQDGDGTFELHELDEIMRRDALLAETGNAGQRPLVFEVLPLVARTFDAHAAVEGCLRDARERDDEMARDASAARIAADRKLLQHPDVKTVRREALSSVRRLSGGGETLPEPLQQMRRGVDESTAELSSVLDQMEALQGDETTGLVAGLHDEIRTACTACNMQRMRLRERLAEHEQRSPGKPSPLAARSPSSSLLKGPRRPHAVPPMQHRLPKSVSGPVMPMRGRGSRARLKR